MMFLLTLLIAAVVVATIATVVELRRDGFRRMPERTFGPASNDDVDALRRTVTALHS